MDQAIFGKNFTFTDAGGSLADVNKQNPEEVEKLLR